LDKPKPDPIPPTDDFDWDIDDPDWDLDEEFFIPEPLTLKEIF
jgi:hypothetical protein